MTWARTRRDCRLARLFSADCSYNCPHRFVGKRDQTIPSLFRWLAWLLIPAVRPIPVAYTPFLTVSPHPPTVRFLQVRAEEFTPFAAATRLQGYITYPDSRLCPPSRHQAFHSTSHSFISHIRTKIDLTSLPAASSSFHLPYP